MEEQRNFIETPTITDTPTQTLTPTPSFTVVPTQTPTATTVPQNGHVVYVYDGDGNLVKSIIGDVVTYYPNGAYELKVSGSNEVITKYYSAGSSRIAYRINGAITWLLNDHLGSTVGTVDEDGELIGVLKYTAYGELRTGSSTTDYRYTGQREETEIGLYFYVARFFDPAVGRFISADTIVPDPGSSQGYDRYGYVNGNPINRNDPSGHFAPLVGAAVGAVVGFSVDILIQAVPQMLKGVSPLDVEINWAEAGGAAVAGLVSGATLGIGTLVAAGAASGVASVGTMAFFGGVGNAIGNQAGAITSGVLNHGFTQEAAICAQNEYGFGNPNKIGLDLMLGGIASGFTEGISQINTFTNTPRVIEPKWNMSSDGAPAFRYSAFPDTNKLGRPITRPNFNSPLRPVTLYTGLTTFSNYSENFFTSTGFQILDKEDDFEQ